MSYKMVVLILGYALGLVGLIDVKSIDVAQPIWSWDCPTYAQDLKTQKTFFAWIMNNHE